MHVVARAHNLPAERALGTELKQLVGARNVRGGSKLAISFRTFDEDNVETEPLGDAGIVGETGAYLLRRGAMCSEDCIEAESLRSLRAP